MTVVITELSGFPRAGSRTHLDTSSAYATAGIALTTLVPVPPGWTVQVHNARLATYHGPQNGPTLRQLIVAQEPTPRILFLG